MPRFPFENLPRYRPRRFLPEDFVADSWDKLAPWFDKLEARDVSTPAALEQWLLDKSEFSSAMHEESCRRHVANTLDTSDEGLAAAWKFYATEVSPKCSPRWHALTLKYLASPARKQLDPKRYFVYDRDTESGIKLYREENIPIFTEESLLDQEYYRLTGTMNIRFKGRDWTAVELGEELEDTDRNHREQAWRALWGAYLEREDQFETLYDRMLGLRARSAHNAGFPDYRAYAWEAKGRYDYTPEDCAAFHEAIAQVVVPLVGKLARKRRAALGVEAVRPWDVRVDLSGKPPLAAAQGTPALCGAMTNILKEIDPELAGLFHREVASRGMVDLDSRPGKAPGGYQTAFPEAGIPFIFNNGAGRDDDLTILAHEAGHAFHTLLCRDEPLGAYRGAPLEFAEVASSAMEFFTYELVGRVHQDKDADRSRWGRLWRVLTKFIGVGTYDGLQHWTYTHPGHSRKERQTCWRKLHERFDPTADWSGFEHEREVQWHEKLHVFVAPFYYVEYGIAYVGALQLWQRFRKDPAEALAAYKRALALGGSRPLPELWEAAGLKFDFGPEALARVMADVEKEFDRILG